MQTLKMGQVDWDSFHIGKVVSSGLIVRIALNSAFKDRFFEAGSICILHNTKLVLLSAHESTYHNPLP